MVYIEAYIRKLNEVLPMLYHPVIKSETSGLPFDYQIFHGGETLILYFEKQISQKDIIDAEHITQTFFTQWNESHEFKVHCIEIAGHAKTQIRFSIDWGGCDEAAVETLIHSFSHQKDIKKIVIR